MTTLAEFKKLVHKSVRVIEYTAMYKEFKWQCKSCKTLYTYKSAAKVLRRKLPCMCLEKAEYQAKLPADVELITFKAASKPCTWKCTRCLKEHVGIPAAIVRNKVNCRCEGFSGAITQEQFLVRLKQSKLPYKLVVWTDPTIKRTLRLAKFQCSSGHIFEAKPNVLLNGKHICPECKHQTFADEYLVRLAEEFPHITLVEAYKGFRHSVLHRCDCGEQWKSKPFIGKTKTRKKGCPVCDYRSGGPKLKTVEFGERTVTVQGYEDAALKYLEQCTNINVSKLALSKDEGVPNIRYRYANKVRLYYPDFYYPPKRRLVEVKSIFTLLSVDYRKTKAKAKACIAQGYNFKLLVVEVSKKTKEFEFVYKLPEHWLQMSRNQLLDFLCVKYPAKARKLQSLPQRNPYVDSNR